MLKSKALRGGPEWVTGPVGIYESEKVWRSLEKGGNLERGRWEVKVLDEVSYASFHCTPILSFRDMLRSYRTIKTHNSHYRE